MSLLKHPFRPVQRLLQAAQFKQVFDHASYKVHLPSFMALAIPADAPRLGLVVAKRKIKFAHERNRFKRLSRESFRLHQHAMPSLDIVIMPKPNAIDTSNANLLLEFAQLWKKLQRKVETSN